MDIRQLSIHYHVEQDRILIRINSSTGDEVHMWLTRRMATRLWPLINQIVLEHFAIPTNARSNGGVESVDFHTPYRVASASRPLGDAPLLVTEVNLTPHPDGQMQMHFREQLDESTSEPRGFQLDLPADLVFALIQLLGKALEQSQWNIGHVATTPSKAGEGLGEMDFAPNATRPTYLN